MSHTLGFVVLLAALVAAPLAALAHCDGYIENLYRATRGVAHAE